MDKRLEAIKKRLAELIAAREAKAAEIAAAKEKAKAAAAAEAEKAAAQRAKAESADKMTREEYVRAVQACQEIQEEARDDLRALAETILRTFNEARLEYIETIEDAEGVLRALNKHAGEGFGIPHEFIAGHAHNLFIGDPNAPGYRAGKHHLWTAAKEEYPEPDRLPERVPRRNIYETPTARSVEEARALEKLGCRRYGLIIEGPKVPTPEEWLDPSIKWIGGDVTEMKPGVDEVPARMHYEGRVQENGVFGSGGRVIVPPKN